MDRANGTLDVSCCGSFVLLLFARQGVVDGGIEMSMVNNVRELW
jgi:hypothetical protein